MVFRDMGFHTATPAATGQGRRWHGSLPNRNIQVGRETGVQTRDHRTELHRHQSKVP